MGMLFSQSISIENFTSPLEVSPLLGGDLQVDIQYTSQNGSPGNNLYIGLEELDENDQFVRTIDGVSLTDQTAGTDIPLTVNLFVGTIHPLSNDLDPGHYYQIIARLYTNTWDELASAGHWNTSALETENEIPYNFSTFPISKGADVSWMSEMESEGYTWKDNEGITKQLMPLLKEYDLDAVRLRVWVDPDSSPANGWCDIDDMVAKAQLAEAEGLDVMVCIHFSDHWADPGNQTKPAAWTNYSVAQLQVAISTHTTDILNALAAVNITPKWVQIGNETNDGLLWETGRASTSGFSNYASFINAGSNAVKSFDNSIKTILHLSDGFDQNLYNWNIGGLLNNGLNENNIDIIGMSLYPEESNWRALVDQTYDNMLNIQNSFNKDAMVVEIGFSNTRPDITYQLIVYMIERTRQAQGLGVFYWEPIAYSPFTSYDKGAWDTDGSPSVAMDAFKDESTLSSEDFLNPELNSKIYPNPANQQFQITGNNHVFRSLEIYSIDGRLLKSVGLTSQHTSVDVSDLTSGIYLVRINKGQTLKLIKN